MADELHVVNISDPTDLTLETTFELDVWDDDVAISGDFAFVVGSTAGILALDARNLADPVLFARLPILGDARAVYVHGDLLLIANQGSGLSIMRAPFTADVP